VNDRHRRERDDDQQPCGEFAQGGEAGDAELDCEIEQCADRGQSEIVPLPRAAVFLS